MPDLSRRTCELPSSPIRKLAPLAAKAKQEGKTVYHLNIGQPDIPTPQAFMDGVRNADIDVLAYSPSPGLPETLAALRGYYAHHGIDLATEQLCVTIGGSEAFTFAMKAAMDPGDEVIIPEPFYPNYRGYACLTTTTVVPITTVAEEGFHLPAAEAIEAKITDRTRAFLFSNPGNPTGVVYTEDELKRIVRLATKHDLFVISDEVYREFVYDGETHTSMLSLPEVAQRVIVTDSLSKRFSVCGARIGCIVSRNAEVMTAALRLGQARLSPPVVEEFAAAAALRLSPAEYVEPMIAAFEQRRNVVYDAVSEMPGVLGYKPAGAFYMAPEFPVDDAEKFVEWMLADFDLDGETTMLAPAEGFYSTPGRGRSEARIAYVLNEEELARAMTCLAAGLAAYPGRTS